MRRRYQPTDLLRRMLRWNISIESLRSIFMQDAQKDIQRGRRRLTTEAYPLGYVEDCDEPRTTLEGFFSILLLLEVFWECHLNLISYDSHGTTGDGDFRIFWALAGLHIESPPV